MNTFILTLFFVIYRFIFWPLVIPLAFIVSIFDTKVRAGLIERLRPHRWPLFSKKPIWIHASSGEFEYAKSLIREIKTRDALQPIVVTYFSPSYAKLIERFPGVDFSLPLPIDLPGPTSSCIRRLSPSALLIARTDLWPELLYQAKKHKIPTLLFSTTFRPLKGIRRIFIPYFRFLYSRLSSIYFVSEIDQKNFKELELSTPQIIAGDTRYDQVVYRLNNPQHLISVRDDSRLNLVAGSTWPEDEKILIRTTETLLVNQKLRLILAPHEPTASHINQLKNELTLKNISFALYSDLLVHQTPAPQTKNLPSVILVDALGILAELYLQADIAFVGGSFRRKVHSVMEALAAGCPTIVGPFHENNREAMQLKKHRLADFIHLVNTCKNESDLSNTINYFIEHSNNLHELKSEVRNTILQFTGRTSDIIKWIQENTQSLERT